MVLPQRSPQKIIVCTLGLLDEKVGFLGRLVVVTVMSPKTYIFCILISHLASLSITQMENSHDMVPKSDGLEMSFMSFSTMGTIGVHVGLLGML